MPRANLIAPRTTECFFVSGKARAHDGAPTIVRLDKTPNGWKQRVLTRDDRSGRVVAPLNFDYVSGESSAVLAEWLRADIKEALLHFSLEEARIHMDPSHSFWNEVVVVDEGNPTPDTERAT